MEYGSKDDKIKDALADPDAPWYGSDLVTWVADLLDERDKLKAENSELQHEIERLETELGECDDDDDHDEWG